MDATTAMAVARPMQQEHGKTMNHSKFGFRPFVISTWFLFCALAFYLFVPPISLHSPLFCSMVSLFLFLLVFACLKNERDKFMSFLLFGLAACVVGIFSTSGSLFFENEAKVKNEKSTHLAAALPTLDLQGIPWVEWRMARDVMKKRISDDAALKNKVKVGDPVKQKVSGKVVWVAFLQHQGYPQWVNHDVTPGYITVSASDPSEVTLVTSLDAKPLAMRYLETSFFFDDAYLNIYKKSLFYDDISDLRQSLDDQGHPFYVATLYKNPSFWSEKKAEAVAVATLDVVNGDVNIYNLENAPAWIDVVYPQLFVLNKMSQMDYGDSNAPGPFSTTDLVYGDNGNAYHQIQIRSEKKNQRWAVTGLLMVDARTLQTVQYDRMVASDSSAQDVAEGVTPQKDQKASHAVSVVVHGQPSYAMAMLDAQKRPQSFALVSMLNLQAVAISKTLEGAAAKYKPALESAAEFLD